MVRPAAAGGHPSSAAVPSSTTARRGHLTIGWRHGPALVYERTVQDESEDLYARLSVEAPHALAGAARRETFTHAIETTDADRINEMLSVGLGT